MYQYELPSGMVVDFREPRNKDRKAVVESVKPNDKVSVDELLAAHCLIRVNGKTPAEMYLQAHQMMDSWTIKDSQTYVALFLDMFTVDEDHLKKVREDAKKLMSPASEAISE